MKLISPRNRRVLPATLAAFALFVAGCGASGGDDEAGTTTTAADGSTTTSSGTEDTSPETTVDDGSGEVTLADLEALLPPDGEFGADYVIQESDDGAGGDEENPVDDALNEACPSAAEFFAADDDSTKVGREFEDSEGRTIEVSYNLNPVNMAPGTLEAAIEAINECDVVTVVDGDLTMEVSLEAEPNSDYGDAGVTYFMQAVMSHPQLERPVNLTYIGIGFVVDGISGGFSVGDGLEELSPTSLAPVEGHYDFLDSYPATIESNLLDLAG